MENQQSQKHRQHNKMTTATQTEQALDEQLKEMFRDDASWQEFIGKYEIVEKNIGRGGEGIVHKVKDKETGTEYAAKVLSYRNMEDFSELKRIHKQASVLEGLVHDNVMKYVDSFVREIPTDWGADTEFILVTELAEGDTLGNLMKKNYKFSTEELVSIEEQILDALAHVHERGIVHRDIKPDNITYDPQTGNVKLLDFGIAKVLGQTTCLDSVGLLGTENYIAPELRRGGSPSPESDLYSVGATMIALARGKEYEGVKDHADLVGYVKKLGRASGFRNHAATLIKENPDERANLRRGKYLFAGDDDFKGIFLARELAGADAKEVLEELGLKVFAAKDKYEVELPQGWTSKKAWIRDVTTIYDETGRKVLVSRKDGLEFCLDKNMRTREELSRNITAGGLLGANVLAISTGIYADFGIVDLAGMCAWLSGVGGVLGVAGDYLHTKYQKNKAAKELTVVANNVTANRIKPYLTSAGSIIGTAAVLSYPSLTGGSVDDLSPIACYLSVLAGATIGCVGDILGGEYQRFKTLKTGELGKKFPKPSRLKNLGAAMGMAASTYIGHKLGRMTSDVYTHDTYVGAITNTVSYIKDGYERKVKAYKLGKSRKKKKNRRSGIPSFPPCPPRPGIPASRLPPPPAGSDIPAAALALDKNSVHGSRRGYRLPPSPGKPIPTTVLPPPPAGSDIPAAALGKAFPGKE